MAGTTVVVTGANGFIASVLVKTILMRGYNVRGTVRNPDDVTKVGHLLELPGAEERLRLYKADLLAEGSFDDVVDGAHGVFHTAAAVVLNSTDPQAEVVDPSVKGTLNVLTSAAKCKSVRRVVFTSSMATLLYSNTPHGPGTVVDESWWTDVEWCKQRQLWYHVAKTLAEQACWNFAKDAPFQLLTVLPAAVTGEIHQEGVNASSAIVFNTLLGGKVDDPLQIRSAFVDVEDVALAHVLAFEVPSAKGRYICAQQVITHEQLALMLKKLFSSYPVQVPDFGTDEDTFNIRPYQMSNDKLRKLGVKVTPLEESLRTTVGSLKKKGALK